MTDRTAWARTFDILPARRHKYGAQKVELDGIRFDSRREARRYQELKLLLAADLIRELEVHPGYPLIVEELYHEEDRPRVFHTIGMAHFDFRYVDMASGEVVLEDIKAKGVTTTTAFRLRKRYVEAAYGIAVREVE